MIDIIIPVILVLVLLATVPAAVKHFKGEGGCCGGGSYRRKRKKLKKTVSKKLFHVDGMSCQHCVNRVMDAVNDIQGASAVVDLKKGTVTVSMDHEIADHVITQAIEKAGYPVK